MSVVKYGLPVPATKSDDAALLEVADRPAPDVRLGDLVHRDRAHDPGRDPGPLERVLEGQAVHHRGEHADVVAGRPVHALRGRRQAAEDVAAADDDADLDAEGVDLADLAGDECAERRIDAVRAVAEERLAGQLEQDAPVAQRPAIGRVGGRRVPATTVPVSLTAPPRARSGRSGARGCSRRS